MKELFTPELFNARLKLVPTENGEKVTQIMVTTRDLFHPHFDEHLSNKPKRSAELNEAEELAEIIPADDEQTLVIPSAKSAQRARTKLRDYIECNEDLIYFFTLTFGSEEERTDYRTVVRTFNQWFDNRVRRAGLKYVACAEYHSDGKAIHFHGLANASLQLADSGTVRCAGHKKPLKISTADRYNIPEDERQTVYNISDWTHGFSTAIKTYGTRAGVAAYVGKYISKSEKVGGRWFYHGGDLLSPRYEYCHIDYATFEGTEIAFTNNLRAKFARPQDS